MSAPFTQRLKAGLAGFAKGYGSIGLQPGGTAPPYLAGGTANWPASWRASAGYGMGTDHENQVPKEKISTLSALQRSIALYEDLASAEPPQLVRALPSGGFEVITNTDLSNTLKLWSYSSISYVVRDVLVAGNACIEVQRNERGGVSGLRPIPIRLVSFMLDDENRMYAKISADHNSGISEKTLEPGEFVPLMYRPSSNPFVGVSPLDQLRNGLSFGFRLLTAGLSTAANIASPGTYLRADGILSESVVARLRSQLDTMLSNKAEGGGFGRTIVLEEGLTLDQVKPLSMLDSQVDKLLQFSIEECSRTFGVPLILLGSSVGVGQSTAAEEAVRSFVALTLQPFSARLSDALAQVLIPREDRLQGVSIRWDFESLMIPKGREAAETLTLLVTRGVMTPDEARNRLGLPDTPGGDQIMLPLSSAPAALWGTQEREAEVPVQKDGEEPETRQTQVIIGNGIGSSLIDATSYFSGLKR